MTYRGNLQNTCGTQFAFNSTEKVLKNGLISKDISNILHIIFLKCSDMLG